MPCKDSADSVRPQINGVAASVVGATLSPGIERARLGHTQFDFLLLPFAPSADHFPLTQPHAPSLAPPSVLLFSRPIHSVSLSPVFLLTRLAQEA